MAFNSTNQYSASHKTWDHVGNIVPPVEHCSGERPHLGDTAHPAAWLPVQFYDKYFENWLTILPGKVLALDPDNAFMPAQYGLTGASVAYTASDVAAGVIDIATGAAVTAAKTVVLSQLTGVRGTGWTAALAGTVGATYTSGFMGRYGVSFEDATYKFPIGICSYPMLQWAGGDGSNPAQLRQHNYNMQHRASMLCDYVLRLPLIPVQVASETVSGTVTGAPPVAGTDGTYSRDQVQLCASGRYNASTGTVAVLDTYPVIALFLDNANVATNTIRTTITLASTSTADDVSTLLVNEKSALSAVKASGDYFVDYPYGAIFIYSADGATVPTALSGAAGTVSITYYCNGTPATLSAFASVVGSPVGGDFLVVTTNSNLAVDNTASFRTVVGQVVGFETSPQGGLEYVRTAWNPAIGTNAAGGMANGSASSLTTNPGQLDQMPGSATGGHPDLVHFAGAADTIVLINLVSR